MRTRGSVSAGLASRPSDPPAEILIFEIGGRRYGLPLPDVAQLVRAVTIEPLPKAPEVVEGIINVRGALVPVLDLRKRFGLPAKPAEITDHLVLARAGERMVALRADRTADIRRVDMTQIEDAAQVVANTEYVSGVAKLPDGLVLIHDLKSFLSQAEAGALNSALEPPVEDGAPE